MIHAIETVMFVLWLKPFDDDGDDDDDYNNEKDDNDADMTANIRCWDHCLMANQILWFGSDLVVISS